jgi:hypothetical protein
MGYRSEVAYTIRFKDEASYRLFIAEAKAKPETAGCFPPNDGSAFDECSCDDARFAITFHAEDVKWYPSYPEVQMHEHLIQQAEDWVNSEEHVATKSGAIEVNLIAQRLGYIFIRIGEEADDIEHRFGGDYDWDWIRVSRQIITDWS